MYMSDTSQELLANYLNSEATSAGCLDYIACHGFITAIALRDDDCEAKELLRIIVDGEPSYQSSDEREGIEKALQQLFLSLSRQLYLGESIDFPHALEPAKPNHTNELTDWCFGFMEGVGAYEEHWFSTNYPVESIAELLIPISIFSEPHVEPGLAHLVQSDKARYALIAEIPENLQQLYLLFRD